MADDAKLKDILAQVYALNNSGADLDRAAFVEIDEAIEAMRRAHALGVSGMVGAAVLVASMVECEDGCDGAKRIAAAFRELQ